MGAKLWCPQRKSASAQRCLRGVGGTIDRVNPLTSTAHRARQGVFSPQCLRKGNWESAVVTGFCRSPGIAVVFGLLFSLVLYGCVVDSFANATFSDWSAPINLGSLINSDAAEQAPAISPDGLAVYCLSGRAGGVGASDLWVSRRANRNAAGE